METNVPIATADDANEPIESPRMYATILAHEKPAETTSGEIHRFTFRLVDEYSGTLTDSISLRTARVIVANLPNGNAFIQMLRGIVAAEPKEYDTLIGHDYVDHRGRRL
jgi:hypothetical protein